MFDPDSAHEKRDAGDRGQEERHDFGGACGGVRDIALVAYREIVIGVGGKLVRLAEDVLGRVGAREDLRNPATAGEPYLDRGVGARITSS